MPANISNYPPPQLPGIAANPFGDLSSFPPAPPSQSETSPLETLGRGTQPGMALILQAITSLREAQDTDPRLSPVIGPALQLLLAPQTTLDTPQKSQGGLMPGGAL